MCDSPIYVKHNAFLDDIPVPCGKCPPCKKRRVDSWVFRLMQEDKVATASHFVTLTYDTRNVPISDHGFMTLDKSDFQKFMKRLRKNTGLKNIRYYAVGEYGEERSRPHYHAIIFNVPNVSAYRDAWSPGKESIGTIDVGQVSGDSIAYVAKYMDKKKNIPVHARDDRVPEFSLMSKGLGKNYLTQPVIDYHRANLDQLYVVGRGGYRVAMPKYYREVIFSDDEKKKQLFLIKDALEEKDEEYAVKARKKGKDLDQLKESGAYARYARFEKFNSKNRKL